MNLPPLDLADDQGGNVISVELVDGRLRRYKPDECQHFRIRLDRLLATVECRDCHAKLNPVEWIAIAAERWKSVLYLYERQTEAARVLDIKKRCKCDHCGRISEVRRPSAAEVRAHDAQERSRQIASGHPPGAPTGRPGPSRASGEDGSRQHQDDRDIPPGRPGRGRGAPGHRRPDLAGCHWGATVPDIGGH